MVALAYVQMREAEEAVWSARRAAPSSHGLVFTSKEFQGEPREAPHMERACAAVAACNEALSVLSLLRAAVPAAVRSPEAADRMLAGCQAEVAAAAARAAAEWARTAALPCESSLADQVSGSTAAREGG